MSSAPPCPPARERIEQRGHEHPGIIIASPVETLLRGLLGANGRRDADARVVEGVRALVCARWAAIFEQAEGSWLCRSSSGQGPIPGDLWQVAEPAGEHIASPAAGLLAGLNGPDVAFGLDLTFSEPRSALLLGPHSAGRDYGEVARRLVGEVAPDLALALRKGDELDTLRSQAFVDALTECYNRRGFDEHLHVELRRAQRYDRSAALMLVDLDGFKGINDGLGHQAGDHVLRRFSAILRATFRNTDVVSRYGGDEFAVIFPETKSGEAVQLAQRVRTLMGETFPDAVIPQPVTASFGIAAYPLDATSARELVASADRALYAAKNAGRDRVVAAWRREG